MKRSLLVRDARRVARPPSRGEFVVLGSSLGRPEFRLGVNLHGNDLNSGFPEEQRSEIVGVARQEHAPPRGSSAVEHGQGSGSNQRVNCGSGSRAAEKPARSSCQRLAPGARRRPSAPD